MLATSFQMVMTPSKSQTAQSNLTKQSFELQSFDSSQSSSDSNQSYQCFKKVSLTKQNKDGANASRTARITLISMIMCQNKKEVTEVLRQLKEDTQLKKLMLNIGEKQFKARFLFKKQLKQFFADIFEKVSILNVQKFMRKNKRSALDYNNRLELSYDYIMKYKVAFEQKFGNNRVLVPIPLKHEEYLRYIKNKAKNNTKQ